jgi:hypothetical protein
MRRILVPTLAICAATIFAGEAAPAATEPFRDGTKDIPVESAKDKTFPFKAPDGLASTELWFQGHDGAKWGAWQKHSQVFPKDTQVVWAPPEGRWQIYLRPIKTSGIAGADPSKEPEKVKPQKEFIIDRSAPQVAVTFPASKAKLRGGDKYTVTWTAADPYLLNAPITLKWSRDGSGTFETIASGLANNGSFEWTVPRDMTQTGVLSVEAGDKAGNVGSAESTALLVDSIKPKGRVTGPTITAKGETVLDLDVTDTGPAGLTAARLWVSQDDGVSWTEGPAIEAPFKSVAWKAPADGKFRLYVIATDGAGNVSAAAQGKVGDQLTVDTGAPTVLLSAAIGISDSTAAGPQSRRDFKPGDRVQVVFTAKDANLVQNSVSVLWQTDASKPWVELGKDLPVDQAFRFQIPADAPETKAARIKVTAADAAGNDGEVVAAESFTIQTDAGVIIIE